MNETVLDRLIRRIDEAQEFNTNVQVDPVVLLWSDGQSQWHSAVSRIAESRPIVRLGDYVPELGQGPAYWVRCVIAKQIDVDGPEGTPILYLPGVDRSDLRAAESCPDSLAPIAGLQYRGQWFSHPNGKDWTLRSFFVNKDRGLGLRLEDNAETTQALSLALDKFLETPIDQVENQQLDAGFFNSLINPDPVQKMLRWIDNPQAFREREGEDSWAAFVQQSKANFGLDPVKEGDITAAERLGKQEPGWSQVWERFAETPERFPGIAGQLRKAKPLELVPESLEAWPQENEAGEDQLRSSLLELQSAPPEVARSEIERLDTEHAWRRGTVWAKLDEAPLAFALEQLRTLADVTKKPLVGKDVSSIASDFKTRGWYADDAALKALAAAPETDDRAAVCAAIQGIYSPWLDLSARAFQDAVVQGADYHASSPVEVSNGAVFLFVDGLRFDVAERLRSSLESSGFGVDSELTLSALPTVTPTAKSALVPIPEGALTAGQDFEAATAGTGTRATIQVLRKLMSEQGVQVLDVIETGDPTGSAWTETGSIDQIGHDFRIRLADEIDGEVEKIATRARELFDAGWSEVRVVTDHGWILLPQGMAKAELPAATVEAKKGRCARLKEGAVVSVPVIPWHWDENTPIAVAPGATCFEANKVYDHGGLSPQECIVQRLSVTAGLAGRTKISAGIVNIKWLNLQCRIELKDVEEGVNVDIRREPADQASSIANKSKETSTSGRVTLVVPDEDLAGESAYIVVASSGGEIQAQRKVTIGKNE